jgi:hypothetical protein
VACTLVPINRDSLATLGKLDRVLMSLAWQDLFPLVQFRKLVSDLLDHSPLLLMTDNVNVTAQKIILDNFFILLGGKEMIDFF